MMTMTVSLNMALKRDQLWKKIVTQITGLVIIIKIVFGVIWNVFVGHGSVVFGLVILNIFWKKKDEQIVEVVLRILEKFSFSLANLR